MKKYTNIPTMFQDGNDCSPDEFKDRTGKKGFTARTKRYQRVKEIAARSYEAMLMVLLERGLAGEAWAQQLYYREFIPKRAKQEIAKVVIKENSLKGHISAIAEALAQFDEVTQDEAIERLKILTALKITDELDIHKADTAQTKEAIMQKVEKLEYLIDMKRNNVTHNTEKADEHIG